MKRRALLMLALGFFAAHPSVAREIPAWDREVVDLFSLVPVQDAGRVKPFETVANVKLLKLNGRRVCRTPDGRNLTPVEWMLDCLFRPEMAAQYKMFRIDNSDVLVVLDIPFEKKRAAYSYMDLLPARDRLIELARQYGRDGTSGELLESQVVNLAENMIEFEQITGYFDFARKKFAVGDNPPLRGLFPDAAAVTFVQALRAGPAIRQQFMALRGRGRDDPELKALTGFLRELESAVSHADTLALIPPPVGSDDTQWNTPADLLNAVFMETAVAPEQLDLLGLLQALPDAASEPARFKAAAKEFHDTVTAWVAQRNEYGHIPMERLYHRLNLFYYSLVLFIVSFLFVSATWLAPKSRWLVRVSAVSVSIPLLLLIAGITLRCLIRGRPPVTTLYETILFVTAVAVALSLAAEWINRQRAALALSAVLGMAGMFLANKYEISEGADTMPSMLAVLNTNFWLATHVTTISIGYAAGLVAGALAHVYIIGRLVRFTKGPQLARVVYGMVCFSLLFSVVGTVLGGIWANESWGRFWGWDPKENGALMIVLWQLAILHARKGRIIGDLGVNVAAVGGAAIVAFSWFGVNLLGVGLHSYGFTAGAHTTLLAFYVLESLFIALGLIVRLKSAADRPVAN